MVNPLLFPPVLAELAALREEINGRVAEIAEQLAPVGELPGVGRR